MTIAFGIGFLGIKGYEYAHKVHERLFPGPNFTLLKVLEKHAPAGAHVGHMVRIDDRRLLFDVEGRELLFTVPEDVAITLDKHPVELSELRPGTAMTVETSPSDSNRARRIEAQSDQVELYLSFYFAMTGLHALHMLIGIPILAAIAVMAWRGRFSPEYYTPVEIGGLYWHFVDIVWVFLFPLLYLVG
ncbi:MAG: cytochrome c oxidase subunit 3 [Planctomycetes bacterium]|nr:cytochrome c oxidase subunit 3 [Planctomycetota bacterium]